MVELVTAMATPLPLCTTTCDCLTTLPHSLVMRESSVRESTSYDGNAIEDSSCSGPMAEEACADCMTLYEKVVHSCAQDEKVP